MDSVQLSVKIKLGLLYFYFISLSPESTENLRHSLNQLDTILEYNIVLDTIQIGWYLSSIYCNDILLIHNMYVDFCSFFNSL